MLIIRGSIWTVYIIVSLIKPEIVKAVSLINAVSKFDVILSIFKNVTDNFQESFKKVSDIMQLILQRALI